MNPMRNALTRTPVPAREASNTTFGVGPGLSGPWPWPVLRLLGRCMVGEPAFRGRSAPAQDACGWDSLVRATWLRGAGGTRTRESFRYEQTALTSLATAPRRQALGHRLP